MISNYHRSRKTQGSILKKQARRLIVLLPTHLPAGTLAKDFLGYLGYWWVPPLAQDWISLATLAYWVPSLAQDWISLATLAIDGCQPWPKIGFPWLPWLLGAILGPTICPKLGVQLAITPASGTVRYSAPGSTNHHHYHHRQWILKAK